MNRRLHVLLLVMILALFGLAGEVWAHLPGPTAAPSAEGAAQTEAHTPGPRTAPSAAGAVGTEAARIVLDPAAPLVDARQVTADQRAPGLGVPEERAWFPARPDHGLPAAAFLLTALVVGVALRWSRRAVAPALILLLALFGFETALHSVHHATDSAEANACAFASAAAHLSAAGTADLAPALLLPPALAAELYADPGPGRAHAHLPPRGRAPPAPLA
jgi:hypothetical protein